MAGSSGTRRRWRSPPALRFVVGPPKTGMPPRSIPATAGSVPAIQRLAQSSGWSVPELLEVLAGRAVLDAVQVREGALPGEVRAVAGLAARRLDDRDRVRAAAAPTAPRAADDRRVGAAQVGGEEDGAREEHDPGQGQGPARECHACATRSGCGRSSAQCAAGAATASPHHRVLGGTCAGVHQEDIQGQRPRPPGRSGRSPPRARAGTRRRARRSPRAALACASSEPCATPPEISARPGQGRPGEGGPQRRLGEEGSAPVAPQQAREGVVGQRQEGERGGAEQREELDADAPLGAARPGHGPSRASRSPRAATWPPGR